MARLFSRFIVLAALAAFIMHSDSAFASEIKPHLENAMHVLDTNVLPMLENILGRLL